MDMIRRPLVAGNWKMNGTQASVKALLDGISVLGKYQATLDVAVFPPTIFLPFVSNALAGSSIYCGAQNVADAPSGAYTGEVSTEMLRAYGIEYVLIGHSERRHHYHESNALVSARLLQALHGGMTPILCVGETLAEREADKTFSVLEEQLAVLRTIKDNPDLLAQVIIAYEPVWAIGTGLSASPEQVSAVHAYIRQYLAGINMPWSGTVRILYGGSVKPSNAADLLAVPDVDGALIGGASLDANAFIGIGKICKSLY